MTRSLTIAHAQVLSQAATTSKALTGAGQDREDFATLDVVSSGRAELWVGVPFEVGAADLYPVVDGRIAKDASSNNLALGR